MEVKGKELIIKPKELLEGFFYTKQWGEDKVAIYKGGTKVKVFEVLGEARNREAITIDPKIPEGTCFLYNWRREKVGICKEGKNKKCAWY